MDNLSEEFTQYQLLDDSIIPRDIWDRSTVMDDEKQAYHRMDVLWHYLSSLKYPDNSLRFPRLTNIGKVVLTIPHSNAEEERLFSMVRKNKAAFRPNLDPAGTLSSILSIKLAAKEPAHCFEPSSEVLKNANGNSIKRIHGNRLIIAI